MVLVYPGPVRHLPILELCIFGAQDLHKIPMTLTHLETLKIKVLWFSIKIRKIQIVTLTFKVVM